MTEIIITKKEDTVFNDIFDLKNFLKNDEDYIKGNWLIRDKYNILPIEWFKLEDFEKHKEEHQYFRKLFKDKNELNLTGFPLSSGIPVYDKDLQYILDKHNTPKATENTKFVFKGIDDFYKYLKNDDDVSILTELLYTSNFELFVIVELDMEVIFICYNNNLKKEVENIYKNYPWLYTHQTYLEHIKDFKDRKLI